MKYDPGDKHSFSLFISFVINLHIILIFPNDELVERHLRFYLSFDESNISFDSDLKTNH